MYYLSAAQSSVIESRGLERLRGYLSTLPCWVPHREVASDLGFSHHGINAAEKRFGPYRWATEFENVHSMWAFQEAGFPYGSRHFAGPEQFFQLCKAGPPGSEGFEKLADAFAVMTPEEAFAAGRKLRCRSDWEDVKDAAAKNWQSRF